MHQNKPSSFSVSVAGEDSGINRFTLISSSLVDYSLFVLNFDNLPKSLVNCYWRIYFLRQ